MRTLMIGYDLNRVGQDYNSLITEIKSLGRWWHYLDSTWLVVTNNTHKEARDKLKAHIDKNDELLIIDVTGDAAAWTGFASSAEKWIHDHL
jgi:hypothetical protein